MSHTPHELSEEFAEHAETIHQLKQSNAHFAKLAEDYHTINRAVHRMETRVEAVDEATEADARRRRLALKDEIAKMLADA